MERSFSVAGYSQSTLTNYSRCLAQMAQYYRMNPVHLDEEQVLGYLHYLKQQKKTPSESFRVGGPIQAHCLWLKICI